MTTEVIFKPHSKSTDEFKVIVNSDEVCGRYTIVMFKSLIGALNPQYKKWQAFKAGGEHLVGLDRYISECIFNF
jgi:hypothetical protein